MTGPESADGRHHGTVPLGDPADFPAALRRLRKSAGLTQRELARRCQLSSMTVNHLERGKSGTTLHTLLKLAGELGYDLALVPRDETAPETALSATESAQQPSAQGEDGNGPETGTAPKRRLRACVEQWPGAEIDGDYDPRCCRFPKSCSASVYDEAHVTDDDLEPVAGERAREDA